MLKLKTTNATCQLITRIAQRAINEGVADDLLNCEMDITACHLNGCPLDLEKLLTANRFNFSHDLLGINRHIDRETGKLRNCFLPRYTKANLVVVGA